MSALRFGCGVAVVAMALVVGGCNREEPKPAASPGAAEPGLGSIKPPASPQMVESSKANVPPGAESQPMGSSIQTGLSDAAVEALRDFTAALAAGDADQAKAFFISAATYKSMFEKEDADAYYASLKQLYDASIDKNIAGLAGATYLHYEMGTDGQAGVYESGSTVSGAKLAARTTIAEDVRAIVRVGTRELEVQVPRMVQTGEGWRALQAIVVRRHHASQGSVPQPPTCDQNPTTLPGD
jgi:hypothetical protein